MRTGLSLHGGSVGQPETGSSTGDFKIWLKGTLRVESLSLSLSGSSVQGTWREASLLGTLKDMQKRLYRQVSLSIGALFGEPVGGLVYRGI